MIDIRRPLLCLLFTLWSLTVSGQSDLAFTSIPADINVGVGSLITWGGGDGSAVTLRLVQGHDSTFITTLASGLTGTSVVWIVGTGIQPDDDYAFQLVQNDSVFIDSARFSIGGAPSASAKTLGPATTRPFPSTDSTTFLASTTISSLTYSSASPSPAATTSDAARSVGKSGLSGGAIAGIVVGSIAALALVVIAAILVLRFRIQSSTAKIIEPRVTEEHHRSYHSELDAGEYSNRHEMKSPDLTTVESRHELEGCPRHVETDGGMLNEKGVHTL